MQSTLLIKQARFLTQELKQLHVLSRTESVSPDLKEQMQTRLNMLVARVSNPTLACLEDLQQAASSLGLETKALNAIVSTGRKHLAYS